MKFIVSISLLLLTAVGFAQSDCKPYVPMSEGAKWEITSYSAKGKETGKVAYELLEKTEDEEKLIFKIKSIAYDKKGKEVAKSEFESYCRDGQFGLSMASMLDPEQVKTYKDNPSMSIEVDASELEIPTADTPAGSKLKDGSLTVSVSTNGFALLTINTVITDRKVEAKESKTTAAGTFDCIKLSQKVKVKAAISVESASIEWYAEGVGMVRSETYNKKGDLSGYSELTKLDK